MEMSVEFIFYVIYGLLAAWNLTEAIKGFKKERYGIFSLHVVIFCYLMIGIAEIIFYK